MIIATVLVVALCIIPSCSPIQQDTADDVTRTANFIIAASDSPTESKQQADYVCDGIDDEMEINAALDACPAGGGEVVLLEGTYYLTSIVNVGDKKVLRGQGYGTLIRPTTSGVMTPWFVLLKVDAVIRNLRLDAMATGMGNTNLDCITVYGDGATIEGCWLTGARNAAIDLATGIDNCLILNNHIWNTYCHSLWIQDGKHNIIMGNTFSNSYGAADLGMYIGAEQNTVAFNHFIATTNLAIELIGAVRNTIIGNICYGADAGGLYEGLNLVTNSHENIIRDNTFIRFRNGIALTDSDNNTISGNLCKNNTVDGILIINSDYNQITNNRCTDDQGKPTQDHGLNIVSGTSNTVFHNDLNGLHTASNFANTGKDTYVKENLGIE